MKRAQVLTVNQVVLDLLMAVWGKSPRKTTFGRVEKRLVFGSPGRDTFAGSEYQPQGRVALGYKKKKKKFRKKKDGKTQFSVPYPEKKRAGPYSGGKHTGSSEVWWFDKTL